MSHHDQLHRFIFEDLDLRGELVQMDASWKAVLDRYDYPSKVQSQLGQAMAAAVILSATIKFDGSLILQAQGDGPMSTLVAQATNQRTVRGLARWQGSLPEAGDLKAIFGQGQMVLTIDNKAAERYQGIVGLEGKDLSGALENYFNTSEQLASRFWLMADGDRAAGLFLQQLPAKERDQEDWARIGLLADTITQDELLNLEPKSLLHRLFNEEEIRLFDPEPVAFRCSCSRERISNTLRTLGKPELQSILQEQETIKVDCEFCNKHYRFDAVDAEQLFAQDISLDSPTTQQ